MTATLHARPLRAARVVLALCLVLSQWPAGASAGSPGDDLKRIEYRTYFRGRYAEAIEALTMFLARTDLEAGHVRRAREFLAASFVLSGRPDEARALYRTMLRDDPDWSGPDPNVFRPEVIAVFSSVREEALALRDGALAHDAPAALAQDGASEGAAAASKPLWKKWWFWGAVVGVLVIAGSAGSSDSGDASAPQRGTVDVGVTVR